MYHSGKPIYTTRMELAFWAVSIIVVTAMLLIVVYLGFMSMNMERNESVDRWWRIAKQAEIDKDIAQDKVRRYEAKCMPLKLQALYPGD